MTKPRKQKSLAQVAYESLYPSPENSWRGTSAYCKEWWKCVARAVECAVLRRVKKTSKRTER